MASVTKVVGTAVSTDYNTTDIPWTNPTNVTVEDINPATATVASSGWTELLLCTMSGNEFAIPAGSSIDGIEITYNIETADGTTGTIFSEDFAQLVWDGNMVGLDRSLPTNIANLTNGTRVSGSSTDRWGIPWDVASVNSSGFGVALRWKRSAAAARTLEVLWVKITVHYTEANALDIGNVDVAISQTHIKTDSNAISSQVVPFPGRGTPKAIFTLFADFAAPDGTADLVEAPDVFSSQQGLADAAVAYGNLTRFSTAAFSVTRDIYSDRIANYRGGSTDTIVLTSLGADNATLTHVGSKSNSRQMIVVALFGSSLSAKLVAQNSLDGTVSETSDITTVGFLPEAVWVHGGLEETPSNGHSAYGGYNHGFADGTNQVSAMVAQNFYDASVPELSPPLENAVRVQTDRVHFNPNYGVDPFEEYWWTIGDFDSSGFTITSGGDDALTQNDDGSALLALSSAGLCSWHASEFTMPTSTGVQALTFGNAFAFTPMFGVLMLTLQTSDDTTSQNSALGDAHAVIVIERSQIVSAYWASENGSNTPACRSGLHGKKLYLADETGALLFVADAPAWSSGGLSLNFTTVTGVAVKGVAIFMSAPDEPSDVTPPELLSATVSPDGTTTTLEFDENVTGQTAFTLNSDGGAVTLSPLSGDGTTTHVFSNSRVVITGESITLDYDSGTGTSVDDSDNALATIVDFAVTNNSTQVAPTPDPGDPGTDVPGAVYRFAALRNTLRLRSQNCDDPRLTEAQRLECRRRQQRISRNG